MASIEVPNFVAQDAPVNVPLVVESTNGRLTDVTVTHDGDHELTGTLSDDARTWTADRDYLDYGTTYTIHANAIDARGENATYDQSFSTLAPDAFARASFDLDFGTEWGVGMPIMVNFDTPIDNKAAVEDAMVVRTPSPVEGAWFWKSDTEAIYRPAYYWPGRFPIQVDMDLRGIEVSPGVYGLTHMKQDFATTDSVVMKVDAQALQMEVWINGEVNNVIAVTTGKDGYETLSGTKVIMSKQRTRVMDNATAGVPDGSSDHYRVEVDYAMRLTMSGEFFHASPWAYAAWGSSRVSHGCTSMSEEDAAWLYSIANVGDPVEITGTSLKQQAGNGITVWNMSWEDWIKGSATGSHDTAPL